jgi:hypothetical protein
LHAARNDIIKSAQDWIAEHKELVLPLASPVEIGDSVPLPSEFPPYNKQPDDLPTEVKSRSAVRIDDEKYYANQLGSRAHMKEELCSANELCQLQSYIVYDEFLSSKEATPG